MRSLSAMQPIHVAAWIEEQSLGSISADRQTAANCSPHNLGAYLEAYIERIGVAADSMEPRFRTVRRGTGKLTRTPLPRANAYAMIQRRAAAAGIKARIGNHSFRTTGITAYLKNGGTLEKAASMANYASTRTIQLYDRLSDEVPLHEVERVGIRVTRARNNVHGYDNQPWRSTTLDNCPSEPLQNGRNDWSLASSFR